MANHYDDFETELLALLQRWKVENYLITCVVHDDVTDASDIPTICTVTADAKHRLPVGPIASQLAEQVLRGVLTLLMRYCGISLHQAVGAAMESVKAAAHEIQREQEKHLRRRSGGSPSGAFLPPGGAEA